MTGRSARCKILECSLDVGIAGLDPERRDAAEPGFGGNIEVGLIRVELRFVATKLQMHRTGAARDRRAERLAEHVGKTLHGIDGGVELRDRFEGRDVVDLLVHTPVFRRWVAASGQRDHRGMSQVSVAQPGGEVHRPDHLSAAHPGPPRRSRIAVGHVGGGFLAMHVEPLDAGEFFHRGHGPAEYRGHHEEVRYSVVSQHACERFRACHPLRRHYLIASGLVGDPTDPVMGSAGPTNMNS